ncbi:MAG: hypothetical protein HY062_16755 [Bacteroidetes bacterium]|nr:hypothetical protein [Bacteroidota bacterium]
MRLKKPITEKQVRSLQDMLVECFGFERNFRLSYSSYELFNSPVEGGHPASLEYIEELKKNLKHDNKEADNCLEISGYYARLNMPKEANDYRYRAIAILKTVIEQHPDSALAWYVMGNASAGTIDFEESMNYYKKALIIKPDFSIAAAALASDYILHQKTDSSLQVMKRYLSSYPNDSSFYIGVPLYYIMNITTLLPKFKTAEELRNYPLDSITNTPLMDDFRVRFKANPNTEYIYRVTQQILLGTFMPIRAITDTSFDMEAARFNFKGNEREKLTKYKPYFENLLKSKEIEKHFYAAKLLGNIHLLLDEREKAVTYMKKVIELRPKKYQTYDTNTDEDYMNLLSTYTMLRDTANFEKLLLQKTKEQPTIDPLAKDYNDIASLYLAKHKFELAKTWFQKAIIVSDTYLQRSYDPSESKCNSLLGLGTIELMNNNDSAAMEYVNQVYKLNSKNWQLFILYGIILLKQNDIINAYEVFKTAYRLHEKEWIKEDIIDYYFEKQ